MSLRLVKRGNHFFLRGKNPKEKIKGFPFKDWNFSEHKGWYTTNVMGALPLREYADQQCEIFFKKNLLEVKRWRQPLTTPKNLKLLDHQPDGVRFCLSRNYSYLNAKPGLGKTIMAAVISATWVKHHPGARIVYFAPPFLINDVQAKFETWAPSLKTIVLGRDDWQLADVYILPDSQIERKKQLREDLKAWLIYLRPEIIFYDEAHRLKTDSSGRTRAFFGFVDRRRSPPKRLGIKDLSSIKKIIFLSGTPAPNGRPIELWPFLKNVVPEFINFCDKHSFGVKYCAAQYNGHGYSYDGVNRARFAELMSAIQTDDAKDGRAFMLRQKKEILKLKRPLQEIVILGGDMSTRLRRDETALLKKYSPQDLMKKLIAEKFGSSEDDLQLATYQRLLGIEKATLASEYAKNILENSDEKLLAFLVHNEALDVGINKLAKFDPFVINAKTKAELRPKIVKEWLACKKQRPLIGKISCMGVGIDAIGVDRMQFWEWTYTPGVNSQAIDRAFRYGMKKLFLVEWLAFRASFDYKTLQILDKKEKLLTLV